MTEEESIATNGHSSPDEKLLSPHTDEDSVSPVSPMSPQRGTFENAVHVSPPAALKTFPPRAPVSPMNGLSLEHFPVDGRRSARSSRSGRLSPTHSAHGSLMRFSITNSSQEKKARKVRFYRNGDRFFKGLLYAVSPERFRTFESLLVNLTTSPVCNKDVLPNGVRHIFSIDGSKKVTDLEQLEEGQSYVCASTEAFKRIDYSKSTNPTSWNPNSKKQPDVAFNSTRDCTEEFDDKAFIRPKLVTVIRNGTKPRKAVRVLLNRKTAHSFNQVLTDITSAIKLDTGAVRKLYTLDGRQINNLNDFFKDDSIFVAYGPERHAADDFDLDDREVRFVSAYQSVRERKRVTLKSPKLPRKPFSPTSSSTPNGHSQQFRFHGSPAGSPRLQRKMEMHY